MTIFIAVSFDPLAQNATFCGFANTKKEAQSYRNRTDDLYFKTFALGDDTPLHLFKWFRSCGLMKSDSTELVRNVGRAIGEVLNEWKEKK